MELLSRYSRNFVKNYFFAKKNKLCEIFWVQNISIFFSQNFLKDVLKSLLRGPKAMGKKYWVVFEKFEKLKKKKAKKTKPRFWRNFLKKKHSVFFFQNMSKEVQKHIFKGTERIEKKYWVVSKIWSKKKSWSTIHPSIHPSTRQYKKSRGSKKDDYQLKKWNQKTSSREDIKQKETQMGPHRGYQRISRHGG